MTLTTVSCCFQKVRWGVQSPIKEEEVMDSFWGKGGQKGFQNDSHDSPVTMKSSCYNPSSLATASPSVAWAAWPVTSVTHLLSNVATDQHCLASCSGFSWSATMLYSPFFWLDHSSFPEGCAHFSWTSSLNPFWKITATIIECLLDLQILGINSHIGKQEVSCTLIPQDCRFKPRSKVANECINK